MVQAEGAFWPPANRRNPILPESAGRCSHLCQAMMSPTEVFATDELPSRDTVPFKGPEDLRIIIGKDTTLNTVMLTAKLRSAVSGNGVIAASQRAGVYVSRSTLDIGTLVGEDVRRKPVPQDPMRTFDPNSSLSAL